MWIDAEGALAEVDRRISDPRLRANAREIIAKGYTVLRDLPSAGACDEAVRDYYEFCKLKNANQRGTKARIVNFHSFSSAARTLLLDPVLMSFLDGLFGRQTSLYTSLTFEYGTEQDLHRDSPYFETRPFGHYFGVWTALEDVREGAGALEVMEGGHRVPGLDYQRMAREMLGQRTELAKEDYDQLLARFFAEMMQSCIAAGCQRQRIRVRAGEKIIWHPWLPHGGSPIADASLTRRSIAAHYVPKDVAVYNVDVFFGVAAPDLNRRYPYGQLQDRSYVLQGDPFFQDSYL
jgi:hypothetical protein